MSKTRTLKREINRLRAILAGVENFHLDLLALLKGDPEDRQQAIDALIRAIRWPKC